MSNMGMENVRGARRGFARTENNSTHSWASSISSMSKFFRASESHLGGVIPSSVLREALKKRQEQSKREGASDIFSQPEEQIPVGIMDKSRDQ